MDTTVQPKAIAHPTDSRLYLKALFTLVGQAKKAGVKLRQSHTRPAKRAAVKVGRHKRYEFGCKVGIAATNREGLFTAAMAFEGNPYDGHSLNVTAAKAEEMTSVAIQRLYVDKGYRGHGYDGKARVMISGNKRGLSPTMKRELKRRSAIEPMIGHAKNEGGLGRNYLLGAAGDTINALLAAAGHNLRLVLRRLALLLARFIGAVVWLMAKGGQISIAGAPGAVFPNIGLRLSGFTTSKA